MEMEVPERADLYAAQTASQIAMLRSVTFQVATAKPGDRIDDGSSCVSLSDMILKKKQPEKPLTREEAAKRSKTTWAVRLGYKEVPK
jgi:hypothetical protein